MTGFLERWTSDPSNVPVEADDRAGNRRFIHPGIKGDKSAPNIIGPELEAAIHEIANLLTTAYQRFRRVARMPANSVNNAGQSPLALSGDQSVHECD